VDCCPGGWLTTFGQPRYLYTMPSSALVPGSLFARDFRVVRRLGEGGMGRVYVVEQLSTGAQRALKLMHPVLVRDERFVRRFEQEAKVGARIQSDHIVQVVAAGVDEETRMPWLAMELLEGERLSELLELRCTLSVIETQEVVAQLCHGLGAAHVMGIVHRDLKPENIFLARARREGIPFTVKLLDFGIAKIIADELGTSHNEALGSVLWMAPEQTLPTSEVSPAADVWSLGLLTFRMLAGVPFWKAATVEPTSSAMVLREVVLDSIVPASVRAAELGVAESIPPGFDAWFDQCVHRDPWKRFADANAAKAALMHVLYAAGGPHPSPIRVWPRGPRWSIRRCSRARSCSLRAAAPSDSSSPRTRRPTALTRPAAQSFLFRARRHRRAQPRRDGFATSPGWAQLS
jgi:eukaryotic-like serine/threonine-protein kinase